MDMVGFCFLLINRDPDVSVSRFISFRYLLSNKKNIAFSWVAILSILGTTIGIATMILVLSVIDGYQTELRERFTAVSSHLVVYSYPHGMDNGERWSKKLIDFTNGEITATSPFIHYETMAIKDGMMQALLIKGISPRERNKIQNFSSMVTPASATEELQKEVDSFNASQPSTATPSIILGRGVISVLNIKIGDTIQLVRPSDSKLVKFRVVGSYSSGLQNFDNRYAFMSIHQAQSFFGMGSTITGLECSLAHPMDSIGLADKIEAKFSLSVKDWQSYNSSLFEAIQSERAVIALIVLIVAIVAGFNILTTLFVSVTQKQKDISILKALGAKNSQIIKIFLNQGFYIGAIGSILGMALSFVAAKLLQTYKFIELPEPYFMEYLPISFDLSLYLTIAGIGILISILAGIYPSFVASRVIPIEGIKGSRMTGGE